MRLTDRQTDRILIARPRLHSTQRGKNEIAGHNYYSTWRSSGTYSAMALFNRYLFIC